MDIAASVEAINGTSRPADCELRQIQQAEIGAYWPLVKAGIEKVAERASDGWIAEDVYMALKQGVSQLLVAFVANYYVGFLVVTPTVGWAGPQLHIWALFNRGERNVLETFLPDLLRIAEERGMVRITMASCRKGWERRARELGFVPTQQHYALEV